MEVKKKRTGNTVAVLYKGDIKIITLSCEEDYSKLLLAIDNVTENESQQTIHELEMILDPVAARKEAERLEQERQLKFEFEKKQYEITERARKNKRIASILPMFETDEDEYLYLKGFNTPIPKLLCEKLLEAHYKPNPKFTTDSLLNFWKWVLLNPNPKAQSDLFDWFATGEFSITESGMIVAYRCVDIKKKSDKQELYEFASQQYLKIKNQKKSPKNYEIYEENGEYTCVEFSKVLLQTSEHVGNLNDIYLNSTESEENETIYTDHHTKSTNIKIGIPVSMPRENCDPDSSVSCSYGYHAMNPSYGLRYGEVAIMILINPMNVVAVPDYDKTKFRCCEYFPIGKVEMNGDKIDSFDEGTFDLEYNKYTANVLNNLFSQYTPEQLKSKGIISETVDVTDVAKISVDIRAIVQGRKFNLYAD
jgi:hypothetical protein